MTEPGLRCERAERTADSLAIGFTPRRRVAGLRFEATDLDWARGTGPVVAGPAEALMLAITGRSVALTDLDGPGVPILRSRC